MKNILRKRIIILEDINAKNFRMVHSRYLISLMK